MLQEMWDEYASNNPNPLNEEDWHLLRAGFYSGAQAVLYNIYKQPDGSDISDLLDELRLEMLAFGKQMIAIARTNEFVLTVEDSNAH